MADIPKCWKRDVTGIAEGTTLRYLAKNDNNNITLYIILQVSGDLQDGFQWVKIGIHVAPHVRFQTF
jgi:hypothetical protein